MSDRFEPDVDRSVDPLALSYGAKAILDAVALYLRSVDDWRDAVRDPEIRSRLLGQLAYAGSFLARITALVETPPDPLIEEARLDLMEAALDVALAGVRDLRSREAPPPE